jgi:hypothetical protein
MSGLICPINFQKENGQVKKSIVWFGFYVLIFAGLFACGTDKGGVDEDTGEVNPPDIVETYEVTGPGTWTMTSTEGDSASLVFSRTSEGLSWIDYAYLSGGINISMMIWSRVLQQYPITEGDTWSESGGSNGFTVDSTTVVEDIDALVEVQAGTFASCVVTSETFSVDPAYNNGKYIEVRKRYFAPAVGLVKVESTWHTGEVTMGELTDYEVHGAAPDDYFPLAIGDWWSFDWTTN